MVKETNEEGDVSIKCMKCSAPFSVNTSTGIIKAHLRVHGYLIDRPEQARFSKEGTLTDSVPMPQAERQMVFEKSLISFFIHSMPPFSLVDQPAFRKMFELIDNVSVPSRMTIQRRIADLTEDKKAEMKSMLKKTRGKVSLTADAWSSKIYRGYMVVTAHWIDESWSLKSAVLEFSRFYTPHTGDAAAAFLFDVIQDWDLGKDIRAITTDNAADMCKGVSTLCSNLNSMFPSAHRDLSSFHVRCIAHIVNLGVQDCMAPVHGQITKIRAILSSLRCSVKRRDVFEEVCLELGQRVSLPCLDCETRWSSTFEMIKKSFNIRRVINATASRIEELSSSLVTEAEWKTAEKVMSFLEAAASITEQQSGRHYITLSVSVMLFKKLKSKCQEKVDDGDAVLSEVAKKMLAKLTNYMAHIENPLSTLARILDPRFRNNFICDCDQLRALVPLPADLRPSTAGHGTEVKRRSFLEEFMDEDSMSGPADDEISVFMRSTMNADRSIDVLSWWMQNQKRYPTLAKTARDVLAVQASSVASESCFSDAGNLITDRRTSLSDESIRNCILLRSWQRALSEQ